jgi:flagellar basal body P-ring formation protein FlgA
LKIKQSLIIMMSTVVVVLTGGLASATELTLRSDIRIVGDVVTLGDLFEGAGEVATIAVFRSPALGKKGVLNSKRIKVAARDNGLNWSNPRFVENVVIRRRANIIELDEIRNRIGEKISNDFPSQNNASQFEISLSSKATPLVMRADIEPDFEIEKFRYDRRSGRFFAIISGPVDSPNARRIAYRGRAIEVIEVPVLVQTVARGQTIKPEYLETKKFPLRRISARTVTEAVDLIGMAVRRSLRANSPIRKSDVEKPKIVRKNTLISVVYKVKSLLITFRGRAMEDGAFGETISVFNSRSRRTIQATVTAPNAVIIEGNKLRQTASLKQ